jgi:hypothetical protein
VFTARYKLNHYLATVQSPGFIPVQLVSPGTFGLPCPYLSKSQLQTEVVIPCK